MDQKIKPTAAIMQREVTRKEFLATLGLGVASIMGFSTMVRLVTGKSVESHLKLTPQDHQAHAGYGASPYGS
jgi:hypothetical protein